MNKKQGNKSYAKSLERIKTISQIFTKVEQKEESFSSALFQSYKELYGPLAGASIKESFFDRLLVFFRNHTILRLGAENESEYTLGIRTGNDARTIVRNIRAGDLFTRIQVENDQDKFDFKSFYSIFFVVNFIFGEAFLILNTAWNIYRFKAPVYSLVGFCTSTIFVIKQLQFVLFENELKKVESKAMTEIITGVMRNLALLMLEKYSVNNNIFVIISFVNFFGDGFQGNYSVNREAEIKITDIFKTARKAGNSEKFGNLKSKITEISLLYGLNTSVSQGCSNFIAARNKEYFISRKINLEIDIANNSIYFFFNIYHNLFHGFQRDFVTSALVHKKELTPISEEDLMVQIKIFHFFQMIEIPFIGLFILKPDSLIKGSGLFTNGMKLFSSKGCKLDSYSANPFTLRHIRYQSLSLIVSESMFPIEEIVSTGEPLYYKYETIFNALIDGVPFLLTGDYFLGSLLNELIDFTFHGSGYLMLERFYPHLLSKENFQKIKGKFLPVTIVAYSSIAYFLINNTGL